MKKIFYLLLPLILTSCYDSDSTFTYTKSVSVIKIDSTKDNVTISGRTYVTSNILDTLDTYAINGTEVLYVIHDMDTCLPMICTQILERRLYFVDYYYIFTSLDGKSSVTIMDSHKEKSYFHISDKINLFTNKRTLKLSKSI